MGIWPFDPSVIEAAAFAPAHNTTTQSAQLVSMSIPSLLIPGPVALMNTEPNQPSISAVEHNCDLEIADDRATEVVTGSMFSVPESLAPQFTFAGLPSRLPMSASRDSLKMTSSHARHMTLDEVLDALAKEDWWLKMKLVWKEGAFKAQKDMCDTYMGVIVAEEEAVEKAAGKAERDAQREADRFQKEDDKAGEKARKADE
jgi:hypothetical protein